MSERSDNQPEEVVMPTYITYVKTTAKGAETMKDTPTRIAQASEWIQKAGGRVVGAYATLGRYDYVWLTEFPDSRAAWSVLPKIAIQGAVTTETAEAMPVPEFLQMVAQA